MAAEQKIVIPEIADYELRRKLLHQNFKQSVARLDFAGSLPGLSPARHRHFASSCRALGGDAYDFINPPDVELPLKGRE